MFTKACLAVDFPCACANCADGWVQVHEDLARERGKGQELQKQVLDQASLALAAVAHSDQSKQG
jgi:hypothetical protein